MRFKNLGGEVIAGFGGNVAHRICYRLRGLPEIEWENDLGEVKGRDGLVGVRE